jgi:CobW/HypB/UreG family nucleotide-binding protein
MSERPTLVIIGGLLGAGKTTLAIEAARRMTGAGRRVGIVTNDQGSGLVDTALARVAHVPVREVAGGCFCCRLSDLLRALDSMARHAPEVIFAEPVGSCVDLAATVLRPLLRDEAARFRVAPLTVLVDPARAHQLASTPDTDLAFLFRHQLEEADIVCYSKGDKGLSPPAVTGVAGHVISAKTGEGIAEWLDLVLGHERPAGQSLIAVDYRRYADAEAALAWLNWQVRIQLTAPQSPAVVVGALSERLVHAITRAGMEIVHVKVLDQAPTGYVRASVCAPDEEPAADGVLDASPCARHDLIVNARAIGDPAHLSRAVSDCLDMLGGKIDLMTREAFRPSAPRPEKRA